MPEATDVLRREHRDIAAVIQMAEDILAQRATHPDIGIREMPEMTTFFLRFADHLHHAKEETVLFPAILRHDHSSITVLDALLEEHQQIRAILSGLEDALKHGQRDRYFETLRGYIVLMHVHMRREDTSLFPLADSLFSPEEQRQLADRLATVQDESMSATECRYWEDWRLNVARMCPEISDH